MADTQIVAAQVSPAPLVYQLPSSVEFILKAVNADYTDNGAAGDWLPAVVIASDSGHVIAYAVDQAVSVGAGDDAAVSWFPGVKHAATSATGLDLPWAYGEADLHTNGQRATYFQTPTSDATLIHYDAGNRKWVIFEPGVYLVFHRANLETNAATPAIGTRLSLAGVFSSPAGGNFVGGALDDPLKAGVLNLSGANKLWNLNEMDVLSIDSTQTPVTLWAVAASSDAADYLLGLNTLIVRTSSTALLDPF